MKIELHTHSIGFSQCGHLSAEELVTLYKAKQFDVLVITNHLSRVHSKFYKGSDLHKAYHDAIRQAQKIGAENGLTVLGGYELCFDENANDYLCYGMTEDFCRDLDWLFSQTAESFGKLAKENGFLFYQAHPFRNRMTVVNPEYIFGIEVQNTHPRHDSRNDIALAWAEKYNLHKIAGSDCHLTCDVGSSAIVTDHDVKDMDDLVHVLKNDLYTIIKEPHHG